MPGVWQRRAEARPGGRAGGRAEGDVDGGAISENPVDGAWQQAGRHEMRLRKRMTHGDDGQRSSDPCTVARTRREDTPTRTEEPRRLREKANDPEPASTEGPINT